MDTFDSLETAIDLCGYEPWEILVMSDEEASTCFNRSVNEISRYRAHYIENIDPPIKQTIASLPMLSTGVDPINKILGGGLVRGSVTEVFGIAGAGKTCLMSQIALANPSTVYFAGEDSPRTLRKRMEDICAAQHGEFDESLRIIPISSMSALRVALNLLKRDPVVPSVIIIDSLVAFVSCNSTLHETTIELEELNLRRHAFDMNCAIILVNQVRSKPRVDPHIPSYYFIRQQDLIEGDAAPMDEMKKRPFRAEATAVHVDTRLVLIRPFLERSPRQAKIIFSRFAAPATAHLVLEEGGLVEGEPMAVPIYSSQNSLRSQQTQRSQRSQDVYV